MLYRKLFYLSHLLCKIFIVFRCVHCYRACVKLNSAHDILGDLRHNNKPGLLPGWTRKDIEQLTHLFYLRVEMLNVLYVVEALRHDYMPRLLSGWTRKDIEQLPIFCFFVTDRNASMSNALRPEGSWDTVRRNTRLVKSITVRRSEYLTLVRSHLGYATQVWTPQLIDLIRYKVYPGSTIHLWPNI